MRVTVLGPWGAYPAAGEATAGYLLEYKGKKILLDCGSGVLSVAQKYARLEELSTTFISHRHHDHIADLGCLQYACLIDSDLAKRSESMQIFIAGESLNESDMYRTMKGSEVRSVTEHDEWDLHGMKFSFFRTFHEVYCLGVKITDGSKTIVYTADTYFDESLIGFCKDADVLIVETSFYAEIQDAKRYGHMNTIEVGYLAKMANPRKVVLTHLPHFGDPSALVDEVKQQYAGDVLLATSGMVIEL